MSNPFQASREGGRKARPGALVALAAATAVGSALAAFGSALQAPEPAGLLEAVSAPPVPSGKGSGDGGPGLPRMVTLQPPQPALAPTDPPAGTGDAPEAVLAVEPEDRAEAAPAPVPPTAQAEAAPLQAQALAAEEDLSQPGTARPFAGVWAPSGEACVPRLNKRGLLPAVISSDGAYAGETSCSFTQERRTGPNHWTFAAACSGPRGQWKTTVRIATEGDRLTWSSKRGSRTYVRCGGSGVIRAGIGPTLSKAG